MANEERVGNVTESNTDSTTMTTTTGTALDKKIKVVGKASNDIADKKAKLAEADKNIENIKQLMAKRRAAKAND